MTVETVGLGRRRALHAFRSRDFRLLWGGQTVSLIGDGAFLVALGWRTTQLTGKSSSLALVLMLHGLGLLATLLVGGALADRYPRRALMIISDLARCGTIAALTAADATGHLSFPLLLGLAVVFGLGDLGYGLTAVASSFLSPATILLAGFCAAAVLWSSPLALRSVRNAA